MYRAIFAAGAVISLLLAGAASAEPTARQRELSARYFKAMHLNENFENSMKTSVGPMMDSMSKSMGLPETMIPVMRELVNETLSETYPKMFKVMEDTIADTWSEEELQAAVTFYESPIGQSIVSKTPAMNARMMPAVAQIMTEQMRSMQVRVREKLCPSGDCSKAVPPGAAAS
jgi:hypothetical protein